MFLSVQETGENWCYSAIETQSCSFSPHFEENPRSLNACTLGEKKEPHYFSLLPQFFCCQSSHSDTRYVAQRILAETALHNCSAYFNVAEEVSKNFGVVQAGCRIGSHYYQSLFSRSWSLYGNDPMNYGSRYFSVFLFPGFPYFSLPTEHLDWNLEEGY